MGVGAGFPHGPFSFMANVYVRSGAAGAGTGADWANAYVTLGAALTAKAAGDTFWVSEDHAETTAGAVTLTSPGTAASPCSIYCVNHSGTVPPVAADVRTTATISTTGANSITTAGFAYCYGITFQLADSTSAGNLNFNSQSPWFWWLDTCGITLRGTGTSFLVVGSTSNNDNSGLVLINPTFSFSATTQQITNRVPLTWYGGTVGGAAVPALLFAGAANSATGKVLVAGADLSVFTGAGGVKQLVNCAIDNFAPYVFRNCKVGGLPSALLNGNIAGQGGVTVDFLNCASDSSIHGNYAVRYQGSAIDDTTVYRSGGATDGATPYSRKIATNANSKTFAPMEDPLPFLVWGETGAAITVTLATVTDGVTLTNLDFWADVEYLGSASSPLASFATGRAATLLTTAANWSLDTTSTWTTTGISSPVKQAVTATFTPLLRGSYRITCKLAKASAAVWVDAKVNGNVQRQYPADGFIANVQNPQRIISY